MIMEEQGESIVFSLVPAPLRHPEVLSLIVVASTRGARLGKFLSEVNSASLSSWKASLCPRPSLH